MRFLSVGFLALQAIASVNAEPTPYKVQTPPLDTPWTSKAGTDPWPEHPRPQLMRKNWKSLNGIWTFEAAEGDASSPPSGQLEREVLVPSCIESGLSGIQETDVRTMWFQTSFKVPNKWPNEAVILNFEAVDYYSTIFLNGKKIGSNTGGYHRISIDITKHVKRTGKNELVLYVHDPTDTEVIPVGKQADQPSHIFYRSCSGIWQSVWIESAPANHITALDVAADMKGKVTVTAHTSKEKDVPVTVQVHSKDGNVIATGNGNSDKQFSFKVSKPDLWSPSSPTLYDITVKVGKDKVESYTGFRTISTGVVDGVQRPLLNGEFVFMFGTLDQGYWPDGLHTPPTREAMEYDLKMLKRLGFNMVRKHIKIEPDLFYRACDEMGLMVVQDMPALPSSSQPNPEEQTEWERQLAIMVDEHKSYPSIVTWVIYNEGWGQLTQPPWPEEHITENVRKQDPSRIINSVTGWHDHGFGDFSDNHHYANPQCGSPFWSRASSPYDPKRIGFQGEFGGIGHNVSIEHLWNVQEAIQTVNETYELNEDLKSYNYRASVLFSELRDQTEMFACSGGVWTQTSDVEGEVNGLYTYDRRILRPNVAQWQRDIKRLYDAAKKRGGMGSG